MHHLDSIALCQIQAVYDGAEGDLWELIMGQQIHVGGMASSQDLAARAGIAADSRGVDLCCCNGAAMRHLLRFNQAAHMPGVDATDTMIERAKARNQPEGFATRTTLVLAKATATGLDEACGDFVWGEDAWCYVADKAALITEAARLIPSGGTIAFTDWVAGPAGLPENDARRFMSFMKFPSLATIDDYRDLLAANGCEVTTAEDTGRYAPCMRSVYRHGLAPADLGRTAPARLGSGSAPGRGR
jgi:ubiquinone/menaquinone biosynthesis C-methylase UbiE